MSEFTIIRELKAENAKLRDYLSQAANDIEDWGAYASEYFQDKHDLVGCVARYHAALSPTGGENAPKHVCGLHGYPFDGSCPACKAIGR